MLLLMAACTLASSQFIVLVPSGATPTLFTPLHLYYISTTGSDANNGLTPATAWASTNHSVVCGDVIILQAGTYTNSGWSFGTVSNCPSTTGGIDGAGGIYFATVLCAGPGLSQCNMTNSTSWAMNVQSNNWAIEGVTVPGPGGSASGGLAANGHSGKIHHIAFVNNVIYNVGTGLYSQDDGVDHDVPGATGFDYVAYVGNITENAQQNTVCTAATVMVGPANIDTNPGTHYFVYGNFSYNQVGANNTTCEAVSDIEDFMFDTFDAHGVTTQAVFMNNVGWSAYRYGFLKFVQNNNSVTGAHDYVLNNTMYHNNLIGGSLLGGDIQIQMDNLTAPTITVQNNISLATTRWAFSEGGAHGPSSLANITVGTTGSENIFKASVGSCSATCDAGDNQQVFNGGSLGTNIYVDPAFNNTTDLLNNQTGDPNCAGFTNVTACLGWNANNQVLTNPSVIYDLTATCAQCAGKGYQKAQTACKNSIAAPDGVNMYPSWLKGIVYLQFNSATSQIFEYSDLVTKPCGM